MTTEGGPSALRRAPKILALLWIMAVTSLMGLSCGPEFIEPTVISMDIQPDTFSLDDTGMTDQFIDIQLQVANFSQEPNMVQVFLQDPNRIANPMDVVFQGNTIILEDIQRTWLEDLSQGVYSVGAKVSSPVEETVVEDIGTITIVQ